MRGARAAPYALARIRLCRIRDSLGPGATSWKLFDALATEVEWLVSASLAITRSIPLVDSDLSLLTGG